MYLCQTLSGQREKETKLEYKYLIEMKELAWDGFDFKGLCLEAPLYRFDARPRSITTVFVLPQYFIQSDKVLYLVFYLYFFVFHCNQPEMSLIIRNKAVDVGRPD